jgi:superfamily II DNA/RNA helicase
VSSYAQRSGAASSSARNSSGSYSSGSRGSYGASGSRSSSGSRGYAPRKDRSPRPAAVRPRGRFDDIPLTVIDLDNLPSFAELGLPPALTNALSRAGITTPFAVQAATIPDALTGRDVLGRAATGAGKTLAFGLPMIARLQGASSAPRRPRGLILVPTRELAMQVVDSLAPLAQARDLSLRLVAGGLPIHKQIQGLSRGTDIVVATPGRLVDLLERRACDLSDVVVTVLDEADHMADLGFLPVVRQLLNLTPATGQRLLFSATLDGDVATLVDQYLTDPAIKALASPQAAVDTMEHHVFRVPMSQKWQVINQIAARDDRTILFVRTKFGAERLADNLNRAGVPAGALHGGRTQAQRTKALNAFKNGTVRALVATDVAARGIHVDDVSLVLHVDPPADPKDYLHRSGRTARAGESGKVVTIVTPNEERAVRSLLHSAGVEPAQRDVLAGDADVFEITGGREPSGIPIVEAPRPAASTGRSRYEGNRSGDARGYSADSRGYSADSRSYSGGESRGHVGGDSRGYGRHTKPRTDAGRPEGRPSRAPSRGSVTAAARTAPPDAASLPPIAMPGAGLVAGLLFWVVFPAVSVLAIIFGTAAISEHVGQIDGSIHGDYTVTFRGCQDHLCKVTGTFVSDDAVVVSVGLPGDPRWRAGQTYRAYLVTAADEALPVPAYWDPTTSILAIIGATGYLIVVGGVGLTALWRRTRDSPDSTD